jgi:hypothetical protein
MDFDGVVEIIREQFNSNHSNIEATMPEAAYLATYRIHLATNEKDPITKRKNLIQATSWLIKALMVRE